MYKVAFVGTLFIGAALVGCSSSRASVSPEEQLAVHFGDRGEMHQRLDPLEGRFEVTTSFWARANAVERVSTGTMTGSWDQDGLCMRSDYIGALVDEPMGLTFASTWDDVRGCYVGVWMSPNGSSAMALGDGHLDESGAIVTVRCDDEIRVREVLRVISADEHVREVHRTNPNGEEYLSMRLHMTRIQD